MASPCNSERVKETLATGGKEENYTTCQLFEKQALEFLNGISLAGFCSEDKYQENPPISGKFINDNFLFVSTINN